MVPQVEWDRRGARTAIPPFSTGTGICYSPKRPSCKTALVKADEIVVYCSDETCIASRALCQLLERNGYTHVLHYVGGLQEWEQAGYPLEGEWVKEKER